MTSDILISYNCKPFGCLPTLFWTLDLGFEGYGLEVGGLVFDAWSLDLALGLGLEARGFGFGHVCYVLCAMGYMQDIVR